MRLGNLQGIRIKSLQCNAVQSARIKRLQGSRIKSLQRITLRDQNWQSAEDKDQNLQNAEDKDQKREIVIKPIVGVGGLQMRVVVDM